jgi:hypothetical protein
MGSRGSEYKEKKRYSRTGEGYVGSGAGSGRRLKIDDRSDDFSRKGVGDALNVAGQRKRGRKVTGESQYRKNKKRRKKK